MDAGSSSSSEYPLSSTEVETAAVDTEEEVIESGEDSSKQVVSLLDRLKSPRPADISRTRKVQCNKPPTGKRACRGSLASDPKGVTPSQRVREFKNENLTVSRGHLFCLACREQLSTKRSIIHNHIQSGKHCKSKEKLTLKEARECDLAKQLKQHNSSTHLVGETLPEEQQMYRVKVVTAFLRAGIPLNKVSAFRDILEESAFRLTDRRNLNDYIQTCISKEIKNKYVSIIFDGTSRIGEALAIVVRFVNDEWKIQQRLVRMQMLSKSLTEEVARELISVVSVNYGISSGYILGAMRDRASTNNVAMQTLKVIYPSIVDIGCFSHTIDHVGGNFKTPILSDFITPWLLLFSHSPKTRLLWKTQTNKSMKSYSAQCNTLVEQVGGN